MIRLRQTRKPLTENIVPMINVAFLMLIFFLMTAVIMPADPVEIASPTGEGTPGETAEIALQLDRDGSLWRDGQKAVELTGLEGRGVSLNVDKTLPATTLAAVLARVQEAGATRVNLVVLPDTL